MKTRRHGNDSKDFENVFYCLYQGNSMFPEFKESDLLEIVPVAEKELRPGDIIAFSPSFKQKLVVHRIVKILPNGIVTRGDNNPAPDSSLAIHVCIAGRVRARYRYGRRKTIHGGALALWLTETRRRLPGLKLGGKKLCALLRPLYHFCSRRTLGTSFMPERFKPRVVVFQNHDCPSFRLLLGSRVIGYYHAQRRHWCIQRPFRLLVHERELPECETLTRLPLSEN